MKRTIFISVLIFLGVTAVGGTLLGIIMPAENTGPFQALSEAHHELVKVESEIAKTKPVCEQLDALRLQREELVNKTNEIINSTGGSFKEAAMPQTKDHLAEVSKMITPPGNDGKSQIPQIPVVDEKESPNVSLDVDLDKLAYAVAMAETSDCTKGMGVTKNNCFGIMTWPNGVRTGKVYASKEESYEDFKAIWSKNYGGFPTYKQAQIWTGNDKPDVWLSNVKAAYYK